MTKGFLTMTGNITFNYTVTVIANFQYYVTYNLKNYYCNNFEYN